MENSENRQKFHIWGGFWVLDGPGDETSIFLNINNIKANPLVRYGGPGEGVKSEK